MKSLNLGFSPCPNDTFIFHGMTHNLVDTRGYDFELTIADVEELNSLARNLYCDITKLSFHAWLRLRESYEILDSGAALGYGCGPLVVSGGRRLKEDSVIALPGKWTTAALLFRIYAPQCKNLRYERFDLIMPKIASGEYDAGVIIHEGRFVYKNYNLELIEDLGNWWERKTSMPIPLGCIAIKREHGYRLKSDIEGIIKDSVLYAMKNRESSRNFIKSHSAELDDNVINEHIALYVNDFTISLGSDGREAIEILKRHAIDAGIIGV